MNSERNRKFWGLLSTAAAHLRQRVVELGLGTLKPLMEWTDEVEQRLTVLEQKSGRAASSSKRQAKLAMAICNQTGKGSKTTRVLSAQDKRRIELGLAQATNQPERDEFIQGLAKALGCHVQQVIAVSAGITRRARRQKK